MISRANELHGPILRLLHLAGREREGNDLEPERKIVDLTTILAVLPFQRHLIDAALHELVSVGLVEAGRERKDGGFPTRSYRLDHGRLILEFLDRGWESGIGQLLLTVEAATAKSTRIPLSHYYMWANSGSERFVRLEYESAWDYQGGLITEDGLRLLAVLKDVTPPPVAALAEAA